MSVFLKKLSGRLIIPCLLVAMSVAAARSVHAAQAAPPAGQPAQAATPQRGGEANIVLPDLSVVDFNGVNSQTLLYGGLVVCALGLMFGLIVFTQLKNLPVHPAMREVSELIYETCKTYLITQGKFILILEVFIGAIIIF